MMFYPDALAEIRAAKIPWPIVVQHLKHGLKEGEVCGTCSAFAEYLTTGDNWRIITKHYCRRAYSNQTFDGQTPACGQWNSKDGMVRVDNGLDDPTLLEMPS